MYAVCSTRGKGAAQVMLHLARIFLSAGDLHVRDNDKPLLDRVADPVKSKDNVTERELFYQGIMLPNGSRSFI